MVKLLYEIFNIEIKKYISYLWPYGNELMNVFTCYNSIFYMPQYLKCIFLLYMQSCKIFNNSQTCLNMSSSNHWSPCLSIH